VSLKSKEKSAILAGEHPLIIRPYEEGCPFKPAEQVVLRTQPSLAGPVAQVSITITGCKRGTKGEWIAEYSVRDDRPLYLRHNSGVTRSAAESLDPEAAITDEKALKEYAVRGRLASAERKQATAEIKRRQALAARSALTEAMASLEGQAREVFLIELQRMCRQAKTVVKAA
jgi:hypothetical protein